MMKVVIFCLLGLLFVYVCSLVRMASRLVWVGWTRRVVVFDRTHRGMREMIRLKRRPFEFCWSMAFGHIVLAVAGYMGILLILSVFHMVTR